ncbi:MAG: bifunctional UDP-N-acetylglucosamine diphosphorylase/glucosamine-1-phosphate N-acetyltransferase GlmU, partial [Pseudomonadota bacterium]
DAAIAVQDPPQGTGDAVRAALPALKGAGGVVCVLYADTPLVRPETVGRLAALCAEGAAVAVLGFRPEDPGAYGRLVMGDERGLDAIVEAKEATPEQLAIGFCNSGVMAFRAEALFELLPRVGCDNAKGEYYLTDMVALARAAGLACAALEADADEVLGVNSKAELAAAEAAFQARARSAAMAAGAILIDPQTVYFSADTKLGRDVRVEPHVVFGPGVSVADGAEIRAFSHLEGAHVATGASVGPYARLRPGAEIGAGARIGNFVEIKKAEIAEGAKVNHLSYVGDASVGAAANIGAGVITCNYDGVRKHRTEIGAGAFIGSNSALVAPVAIGEDAYVGSGSVITKDVPTGVLALTRAPLKIVKGWVAAFKRKAAGE